MQIILDMVWLVAFGHLDLEKGRRVAENIHSGMVWVNTWLHRDLRVPFGGVKDSGVGREGGKWSLGFFSEPLNVCVRHD